MIDDSESNNTDTNPNPEFKQFQQQKRNLNSTETMKELAVEKLGGNNEESFANLSENEVKGLITPDKDSGNTIENPYTTKKSESKSHNPQINQNYASYVSAQYVSTKVNQNVIDPYSNRQTSHYQSGYAGRMSGTYNTVYANSFNRSINTGIGASKLQFNSKKPQQALHNANDSKLQQDPKIIEYLKKENKVYKDFLNDALKQKDYHCQSVIDEYKEIIKQKNEHISNQNTIIKQLSRNYSLPPQSARSQSSISVKEKEPVEEEKDAKSLFSFGKARSSFKSSSIAQHSNFKDPAFSIPYKQAPKTLSFNVPLKAQPSTKFPVLNTLKDQLFCAPTVTASWTKNESKEDELVKSSNNDENASLFNTPSFDSGSMFKIGGNIGKKFKNKNHMKANKKHLEFMNFLEGDLNTFEESHKNQQNQQESEDDVTKQACIKKNDTNASEIQEGGKEEDLVQDKPTATKTKEDASIVVESKNIKEKQDLSIQINNQVSEIYQNDSQSDKNAEEDIEIVIDNRLKEKDALNIEGRLVFNINNWFPDFINHRYDDQYLEKVKINESILQFKNRESLLGKCKIITKYNTGELQRYKTLTLDCIWNRDENYAKYKISCRLWANSSFLDSTSVHKIIQEMVKLKYENRKIPNEFCPEWTQHHMRFSLWKLFAYERNWKEHLQFWNPENLIHDLMRKFNLEFEQGKRSFLQRVVEGDEQASRHAVLLVANIQEFPDKEKYIVELFDGRYSLFSVIHNKETNLFEDGIEISKLIRKRIFVGQKLHVAGSLLIPDNVDEDIDQSFKDWPHYLLSRRYIWNLSLNFNSITRARANWSLGYFKDSHLIKSLKEIHQQWHYVSRINVYITKVYPIYFVHKTEDNPK